GVGFGRPLKRLGPFSETGSGALHPRSRSGQALATILSGRKQGFLRFVTMSRLFLFRLCEACSRSLRTRLSYINRDQPRLCRSRDAAIPNLIASIIRAIARSYHISHITTSRSLESTAIRWSQRETGRTR